RHLGQLDARIGVLVERPGQSLLRRDAQMVAAMRADLEVLREIGVEDHLLAGGALLPEILRHLAPREQRADLRADVFGEPAHGRAPCRSSARSTWSSRFSIRSMRSCNPA